MIITRKPLYSGFFGHLVLFFLTFDFRDYNWSVILYYEENKPTVNETDSSTYITETEEELNADELKILESLKYWRSEKAKDQKLPAYFIATNKELLSIARYRPAKKEELLDIKGFGKHKIENYGEEIIDILDSI
ncbi:hypothetical protein CO230_08595 [Chryseobacterium sp. 6424]|nr:hypothetical protein CO230_08595 [Chryseobacterium sp. 6424]